MRNVSTGPVRASERCESEVAWVKVAWRGWWRSGAESSFGDEDVALRAYGHWGHAEKLLAVADSQFHRIDIVTALKRAIDQRLRALREKYQLNRLRRVAGERKNGDLQTLERLNLARPFMLGKLMRIRNAVEHQDSEPPRLDECRELVELVWYFLKSTDRLVCEPLREVELTSPEDIEGHRHSMSFAYDFGTWLPRFWGVLPREHICREPRGGWAEVQLDQWEERRDFAVVLGEIRGPVDVLWFSWRDYFAWAANGPRAVFHERR